MKIAGCFFEFWNNPYFIILIIFLIPKKKKLEPEKNRI